MIYIILIGVAIFLLWFFVLRKFKFPKLTAITMFTGGVKTGKSAVSLYFAIKSYKKRVRAWHVRRFFCKIFRRQVDEKPLLYSNIPLHGLDYVPVTHDMLMRKVRFAFKSVVFLDEASLVADSKLIKDEKINRELLLFFKLFGHETHGGLCIVNSQCITDLHYALKRCTSSYFYIHHLSAFPFFRIPKLREEKYSDDGTAVNVYNDDIENSMLKVIIRSSIFKKYDSYCFSFFTDSLPVATNTVKLTKYDSLKAERIVSFRPSFQTLEPSLPEDDNKVGNINA